MKRESGQTLVEVLAAIMVGAIMIIAVISVVLNSMKSSQFAQSQTQATKYAQEAIEKIKDIRIRNGTVSNYFCGTGCTVNNFSDLWTALPNNCSVNCYFIFGSDGSNNLTLIGSQPSGDHPADPDQSLVRYITLLKGADDNEMIVSVKVEWSDSSGLHESNLQTKLTK